MSPYAQRLMESYKNLTFWELHNVQRVHITDYLRYKAEGLAADAARVMEVINALGEVLDRMDGTVQD